MKITPAHYGLLKVVFSPKVSKSLILRDIAVRQSIQYYDGEDDSNTVEIEDEGHEDFKSILFDPLDHLITEGEMATVSGPGYWDYDCECDACINFDDSTDYPDCKEYLNEDQPLVGWFCNDELEDVEIENILRLSPDGNKSISVENLIQFGCLAVSFTHDMNDIDFLFPDEDAVTLAKLSLNG